MVKDVKWFKGKRVTVFGIGLLGGGISTIRFLVENGAKVIATDIKNKKQLAPALEQLKGLKNVEYVLGQHRNEDFAKVDMVIKTPQIPWTNKHIKLAIKQKIPVEIDSSLFFALCKNPIIGITGTKGKTTTSHLIYHILKKTGKQPVMVGVGQTPVLDRLRFLKKKSVVVFELSSWRLSVCAYKKYSPHIAVITNFFPDHLNYYRTMNEYLSDKKNIFTFQKKSDWFVCNVDNENTKKLVDLAQGFVLKVSQAKIDNADSIFVQNREIFVQHDQKMQKIVSIDDIPLRGKYNVFNVMNAIGAVYAYGVALEDIGNAIKSFNGVPHRLEYVATKKGVKYYNDTAATNPNAAICAVQSFTQPVILIAGGSDKKLFYADFAKLIAQTVKGVVFLRGDATDKIISLIKEELKETHQKISFEIVDAMDKAVEIASRVAQEGDVVLLSPGASSFGIFDNEFDRGNQFKKEVEDL